MHEMSLAEGVLQLMEDAAVKQGFTRVKTVWLELGQMAGVEEEALRFCFEVVARETLAHEARLEIEVLPGLGWCTQCDASVPMAELFDACPKCGDHHLQVTAGTEMRVRELEVY